MLRRQELWKTHSYPLTLGPAETGCSQSGPQCVLWRIAGRWTCGACVHTVPLETMLRRQDMAARALYTLSDTVARVHLWQGLFEIHVNDSSSGKLAQKQDNFN